MFTTVIVRNKNNHIIDECSVHITQLGKKVFNLLAYYPEEEGYTIKTLDQNGLDSVDRGELAACRRGGDPS